MSGKKPLVQPVQFDVSQPGAGAGGPFAGYVPFVPTAASVAFAAAATAA
jgi:hypothetical protein